MRIEVKSCAGARDDKRFLQEIAGMVEGRLSRFGGRLKNVDVLIIDDRVADHDKACIIEARMKGLNPIAVHAHADTFEHAVTAGARKMEEVLDDVPAEQAQRWASSDEETIDWTPDDPERN